MQIKRECAGQGAVLKMAVEMSDLWLANSRKMHTSKMRSFSWERDKCWSSRSTTSWMPGGPVPSEGRAGGEHQGQQMLAYGFCRWPLRKGEACPASGNTRSLIFVPTLFLKKKKKSFKAKYRILKKKFFQLVLFVLKLRIYFVLVSPLFYALLILNLWVFFKFVCVF